MLDPLVFENYNVSDACREQVSFFFAEFSRTCRNIGSSSSRPFQLRRLAEYAAPQAGVMLPTPLIVVCCIPVIIIILLTVFGNLLVLFFKARVGRTNTTLLVWNLGLTDFLVGIIVLPLGAFHLAYRKWIFGRFLCRVWVAADVTFCTCSVVSCPVRTLRVTLVC